MLVAAARALEAHKAEPLILDPYAELFCRAIGGQWADVLDGKAPEHRLSTEFGVHFQSFQAARTRYFDDYFRNAADAGVRQVVLLAAGLDSRAYRLPWPDGTMVYELDQPEVLRFKREVLAEHGDTPAAERREVAVDLREDWPQALQDSGFDPAKPSAWLAEGLLVYLPAVAQEQLFIGIDRLASSGSHLAVEDGIPMPDEAFRAAREKERAEGTEDPWFALIYNERHAPAVEWLSERGWTADATALADYLQRVGAQLPAPDSEWAHMIGAVILVSAVKA